MSQIVDDLRQVAIEIKTETQVGGNTAARVGGAFERVADALEGTQQIEDMDAAVAAVQKAAQENEQTIQNIVNSLAVVQTTGQSTSAVMSQKAVTGALDDLSAEIGDIGSSTNLASSLTWNRGNIQYNTGKVGGTVQDARMYFDYVDVSSYDKIRISMLANPTTTTTGLAWYDASRNYISGVAGLPTGAMGSEVRVLDVPTNAVYVRSCIWEDYVDGFVFQGVNSSTVEEMLNIAATAEGTSFDNSETWIESTNVQDAVDELADKLNEVNPVPLTSSILNYYIDLSNNKWAAKTSTTYSGVYKVTGGKTYKVVADSVKNARYTFLKTANPSVGVLADYATGYTESYKIQAGTEVNLQAPSDANYLYCLISRNEAMPSSVILMTLAEMANDAADNAMTSLVKSDGIFNIVGWKISCYLNHSNGVWTTSSANTYGYVYPICGGSELTIIQNSTYNGRYFFIRTCNPVNGVVADMCAENYMKVGKITEGTTVILEAPNDANFLYFTHNNGFNEIPAKILGLRRLQIIDFVGDSMTQRGISNSIPMGYYPSKLLALIGGVWTGTNIGYGGENVATVLGRSNAIPMILASDVAIPADTSSVTITLTNAFGHTINMLAQRDSTNKVTIDNIAGTLTNTGSGFKFNRDASGTAYSAKKGDIVYFDDYNYMADDKRCKIIWLGENRGYGSSDSPVGDPANADDRKRLISMLKTAISAYECHRYIVVSPPVRTNEELEAEMQQEFGIHFFNDRMYMVNHGIDDAIALGYLNPSTYPTAGDLEDMANGICPRSLRYDATHYTQNGYYTFAFGLYKHILKAWNL